MDEYKQDIKTIIEVLAKSVSNTPLEENKEIVEQIQELVKDKNFFTKLESGQYKFVRIITEVINIPDQKNKYILDYIIIGLYEHFHTQLIERVEGVSCSADKARFIKNMTLIALKENKNLSLYDDYTKCEEIKKDKERQAYWSPRTIKDTDTAMKKFWDWYLLRI